MFSLLLYRFLFCWQSSWRLEYVVQPLSFTMLLPMLPPMLCRVCQLIQLTLMLVLILPDTMVVMLDMPLLTLTMDNFSYYF